MPAASGAVHSWPCDCRTARFSSSSAPATTTRRENEVNKDPNCIFCKLVAKQIPATIVHEDDATLAFMDIGQVNPGHVLVAAKAHAENIYALDDATAAAVFRSVARVARAIREAFAP